MKQAATAVAATAAARVTNNPTNQPGRLTQGPVNKGKGQEEISISKPPLVCFRRSRYPRVLTVQRGQALQGGLELLIILVFFGRDYTLPLLFLAFGAWISFFTQAPSSIHYQAAEGMPSTIGCFKAT